MNVGAAAGGQFVTSHHDDIVGNERVQMQALANDEQSFGVGFDKTWLGALIGRLSMNEKLGNELLDNEELRAGLLERYRPDIYQRARVARQRTARSAS